MEYCILKSLKNALRNADSTGEIRLQFNFSKRVFKNAPSWNPGPGFRSCIDYRSWFRDDGRLGTITAVVVDVPPRKQPTLDGRPWVKPEIWTAQLPPGEHWFLWDKPHHITWLMSQKTDEASPSGIVIKREPFIGHPSQKVLTYWEAFEKRWGFLPHLHQSPCFGYYVTLSWNYEMEEHTPLNELARGASWLLQHFEAKLQYVSGPVLQSYDSSLMHRHPVHNFTHFYPWQEASNAPLWA